METTNLIARLYFEVVIKSLFVTIVFTRLLSRFFSPGVYHISKQIIRWHIIAYGVVCVVYWFTTLATSLTPRATGPYAAAYWMLSLVSCLLPFVLLLKPFRNSARAIFWVALISNAGWIFEIIVIMVTSLHRDYLPTSASYLFMPFIRLLVYGIVTGIFITAVSLVVNKYRKTNANDIKAL
jgi:hypothetical protein